MKTILINFLILTSLFGQINKEELLQQISIEQTPVYNQIKRDRPCAGSERSVYPGIYVDFKYMKIEDGMPCFGDQEAKQEKLLYGFVLINQGSQRINPLGYENDTERSFKFNYLEKSRQQIHLVIEENANPMGRISHWHMLSSFYFVPRKILPYLKKNEEAGTITVYLPTKETVTFDLKTKEIISGVLKETYPMDDAENRHKRKFPGIEYSGEGYIIRANQRGSMPEADMVWGVKKFATISKNGKTCRVRAHQLWDQTGGEASRLLFKFPTDEEFYQFVAENCPKLTRK